MKLFDIPSTPTCKVVYIRDGVTYSGVLNPTPKDNHDLQRKMLDRKVGMSQVQWLEPIQPRQDVHRPDPAQHRMAQYMAFSARD